jgi:DNA-binding transcriptional ArsR family regulator
MGTTKSDLFNKKQNETASLLKAIAHPARIAIVEYLMNVESCVCGDIVNQLPLAQPTVSQHLKELKSAGIIQGSIEGNTICPLGDAASWPVAAAIRHFREEFEYHVRFPEKVKNRNHFVAEPFEKVKHLVTK